MNKQFFWLLLLVGCISSTACKKSELSIPTAAEEDASIKAFIAKKSWTAKSTTEGIYYVTDVEGTGATPALTDFVNIKFKGYMLDETVVFNSKDSAYEYRMSDLMPGLQIGLQKFKAGSKGKILIPSAYAFGNQGTSTIPANSILVFEVELVNFQSFSLGDDKLIKAFIAKKGWTAQSTPEGIYYVTDVEGTGATPTLTNSVTVFYKGYLLDETVFDSNLTPKPAVEFALSNLIKGWQIGFQKFKAGGKGKLIIPSAYGYGGVAKATIPANSVLVFDVELVSFR